MTQNTSVDRAFVQALQSSPTGIYYRDVAHYSSEKIETEFRNATAQPELVADEEFMANVLFLIRKREIRTLHDDVARLIQPGVLKPRASVSALKTMVSLGTPSDMSAVDRNFSELQRAALKDPHIQAEILPWAERVGGPQTLAVLRSELVTVTREQRAAESTNSPDFTKVSQLDRVRSSLENQEFVLKRKLEIDGMREPERAFTLTDLYMRRVGHLAIWSYKQLVDNPSPASAAGVRAFMSDSVKGMVPKSASGDAGSRLILDLRLRGLCLLLRMGQATPQETDFIEQYKSRIEQNPVFYRPNYDWEDVLDRL